MSEKIKLIGISRNERRVVLIIEKSDKYLDLRTKLITDVLRDEKQMNTWTEIGDIEAPIEKYVDKCVCSEDDIGSEMEEIFGKDRVFLIINTPLREKLNKFLVENCEVQNKPK